MVLSRLAMARVVGATGSVLVAVGGIVSASLPTQSPLLQVSWVTVARDLERSMVIGRVTATIGLLFLTVAWCQLCRSLRGTSEHRAIWQVRGVVMVWSLPLLATPAIFSRDGWSYAAISVLRHRGLDPYVDAPSALSGQIVSAVDPMWIDTVTPYGPLQVALAGVLASWTEDPWLLVILHRVLALIGLGLLAWAVPRLARWGGGDPVFASALVLASPLTMLNAVAALHNDVLMVGVMACALVVAIERGWAWGLVLGAVAASLKLPGGLVCLPIALLWLRPDAPMSARLLRLVQSALIAGALVVAIGWGTGSGLRFLNGLSVPASLDTFLSATTQIGRVLSIMVEAVGGDGGQALLIGLTRLVGLILSLVALMVLALRRPTGDHRAAVATAALGLSAFVVLGPIVHPWYLLWVLPFAASVVRDARLLRGLTVLVIVVGVASPLVGLVPPLGGFAIIIGMLGMGLGWVARTRRVDPRFLTPAAGAVE